MAVDLVTETEDESVKLWLFSLPVSISTSRIGTGEFCAVHASENVIPAGPTRT
jgi:hypothetical protein